MATLGALVGPPTPNQVDLPTLITKNLPSCRVESASFLVSAARLRRASRGEAIFRQGEELSLTLILRGYGAFRRTTVQGQQLTIGIANPGEMYGITSISATVSTVELVALTDCEIATWPGHEVRRLAAIDPTIAFDVIDRLSLFLSLLTEKLDGFLHQDSRRRVVSILIRHRDLFFADPPVISRAHLPGLVGTSREMTGRVLRQLEREGTIARVGQTGLKLLDPGGLEADM